jgi:hypothetical protein
MRFFFLSFVFLITVAFAGVAAAQSTNQNFPTPITSTEIEGTIKARDVGDARLTSYYYQFDAGQGDLFINIVTRNLTADIDVFTMTGLKPLTKIVVYGDLSENETGRVLYFRKPEKLILRIQGRTPGDETATFRIKFAGSFVASTQTDAPAEPALPSLTAKSDSGIRVNSVGTIVAVIPKATPTPVAVATVTEERDEEEKKKDEVTASEKSEEKPADTAAVEPEKKVEVVVTENVPLGDEKVTAPKPPGTARGRRKPAPPVATVFKDKTETDTGAAAAPPKTRRTTPPKTTPPKTTTEKAPDPLEKINLVIEFKDGSKIERPMSEVLRFSVDKGVLTVIAKDGSIGRYSILTVDKVTIQ